jgi:putative ABC transport system ATP-binding protein
MSVHEDLAPEPAGTPVLELRDVWKIYPGEPPVEPVRGVSLAVAAGDKVAVLPARASRRSCT